MQQCVSVPYWENKIWLDTRQRLKDFVENQGYRLDEYWLVVEMPSFFNIREHGLRGIWNKGLLSFGLSEVEPKVTDITIHYKKENFDELKHLANILCLKFGCKVQMQEHFKGIFF